ncbi:hypothetical protein SKAU_G00089130 [Synaphobranchus kaupii]|uniref:Uncharacterized protein n=1 Tax=Synaphobranchus kaupii TaxID=118154 RepID=A0A9Q1F0R3_SYNKA|nr:hypothetical protein SKAU_G00416460 [Synaphobranchus kaupii]KAJ8348804.1 hypothetical protein SKAU_G00273930 [Synaphobranchus kaupii]KAJ8368885.1 hypothetical protein SKAU_G00089130 [Synaphobranchus kaupii]
MSSVDEACNDPVDLSFQPPSSTSTSSPGSGSTSARSDHPVEWDERKWVVNESRLMALFRSCQRCGIPIEDIKVSKHASQIKVEWRCLNGHQDKWSSCPDTRGMAENNLLISSATLFTGTTYTEIVDWARLLNLQIPQKTQYYAIQSTYLIPVINFAYKENQQQLMTRLKHDQTAEKRLELCGDARCDSPGYSAKYSTYSFMHDLTKEIVHFELLQELTRRWKSLLHHICGVHRWEEDGVNYTCHHRSLTPDEQRRKKWLQPDSPAYKALSSVVLDKKLLLDLKQMANFKHTGALEVYHSAMLKYAPKRLHFNYNTMRARTQLTILDHNSNVGRPQAVTEAGTMRYSITFPKQTKDWVAKKLYVPTTQAFRKHLVELVLERRQDKTVKYKDPASKVQLPPRPGNIANVPKPPKAEVVARSRSRFQVNEEEND